MRKIVNNDVSKDSTIMTRIHLLFCMPFPALLQLLFLLIVQVCCDILFVTMLIKLLYCVNFNFILNVTFN